MSQEVGAGETSPNCLDYYLGIGPSYVYFNYAVSTFSQVMDTIRAQDFYAYLWSNEPGMGAFRPLAIDKTGCEHLTYVSNMQEIGQQDIPNDRTGLYGDSGESPQTFEYRFDDDGETSLAGNSYSRLREGVERFFVTDINNPAGSAQAQSTMFVMADMWAGTRNEVSTGYASQVSPTMFNHVPGGANILYMDGHVAFVRYGSQTPVWNPPGNAYGFYRFTRWSISGGQG